jgi:hypothetical protein
MHLKMAGQESHHEDGRLQTVLPAGRSPQFRTKQLDNLTLIEIQEAGHPTLGRLCTAHQHAHMGNGIDDCNFIQWNCG